MAGRGEAGCAARARSCLLTPPVCRGCMARAGRRRAGIESRRGSAIYRRMTALVKPLPADLLLDARTGWPAELRLLIDRYPREVWAGHANLGAMAQFWLSRHAMFREIGDALAHAAAAFRDGSASAADLRAWFPPRLQFFLQQLNAHHQIEDLHYFPVFQAAESRLAYGFDVLESDHGVIHAQIDVTVEAANAFLRTPVNDEALRGTAERYTA